MACDLAHDLRIPSTACSGVATSFAWLGRQNLLPNPTRCFPTTTVTMHGHFSTVLKTEHSPGSPKHALSLSLFHTHTHARADHHTTIHSHTHSPYSPFQFPYGTHIQLVSQGDTQTACMGSFANGIRNLIKHCKGEKVLAALQDKKG